MHIKIQSGPNVVFAWQSNHYIFVSAKDAIAVSCWLPIVDGQMKQQLLLKESLESVGSSQPFASGGSLVIIN